MAELVHVSGKELVVKCEDGTLGYVTLIPSRLAWHVLVVMTGQ